MNKLFLFIVVFILCSHISFAKIWRVNNNAGVVANFTTAQDANDNASVLTGDTIHLEPSVTSYGSLVCGKRLVWIGTGHFLDIHPNLQFSINPGTLDALSTTSGGSNSVFLGLTFNDPVVITNHGIRLDRCFLNSTLAFTTNSADVPDNFVVINCFIRASLSVASGSGIITNNIVGDFVGLSNGVTSSQVMHNIFNALTPHPGTSIENAIVENNIFCQVTAAYTFTNCTVQYNMSGAAGILPAGNNNQNGINMANVFVNNNGTDDASFVLRAGSPAISAGSGSPATDLGAFGGPSPFKLGLQPGLPAIYKIKAPASPSGGTLNVIFSTKSNN